MLSPSLIKFLKAHCASIHKQISAAELRVKWRGLFIEGQRDPKLHALLSKLKSERFTLPDVTWHNDKWELSFCLEGPVDCCSFSYTPEGYRVETETWGHDGYESTTDFDNECLGDDLNAVVAWLRVNQPMELTHEEIREDELTKLLLK